MSNIRHYEVFLWATGPLALLESNVHIESFAVCIVGKMAQAVEMVKLL